MSEIRNTTVVHAIRVQEKQSQVRLAELVNQWSKAAALAGRTVTRAATSAAVLARKGVQLVNEAAKASRAVDTSGRAIISPAEITPLLSSCATVPEAVERLASAADFEIPVSDAPLWQSRLSALAGANDVAGVAKFGRELIESRQVRMRARLLEFVAESAQELGFTPKVLGAGEGPLVAKSPDGRQTLSIEVENSGDGNVKLHLDADGFHGSSCVETLEAFETGLARRGVIFGSGSRRRKDRNPVRVANRSRQVQHISRGD